MLKFIRTNSDFCCIRRLKLFKLHFADVSNKINTDYIQYLKFDTVSMYEEKRCQELNEIRDMLKRNNNSANGEVLNLATLNKVSSFHHVNINREQRFPEFFN